MISCGNAIPNFDEAPIATQPLIVSAGRQLGAVPSLFQSLASSPVVLDAYVSVAAALSKGAFGDIVAHLVLNVIASSIKEASRSEINFPRAGLRKVA